MLEEFSHQIDIHLNYSYTFFYTEIEHCRKKYVIVYMYLLIDTQ